jgi:hypothetical protein
MSIKTNSILPILSVLLMYGSVMGQEKKVISSFHLKSVNHKDIKCNLMKDIDLVSGENRTYVYIAFDDDDLSTNNGYITKLKWTHSLKI